MIRPSRSSVPGPSDQVIITFGGMNTCPRPSRRTRGPSRRSSPPCRCRPRPRRPPGSDRGTRSRGCAHDCSTNTTCTSPGPCTPRIRFCSMSAGAARAGDERDRRGRGQLGADRAEARRRGRGRAGPSVASMTWTGSTSPRRRAGESRAETTAVPVSAMSARHGVTETPSPASSSSASRPWWTCPPTASSSRVNCSITGAPSGLGCASSGVGAAAGRGPARPAGREPEEPRPAPGEAPQAKREPLERRRPSRPPGRGAGRAAARAAGS